MSRSPFEKTRNGLVNALLVSLAKKATQIPNSLRLHARFKLIFLSLVVMTVSLVLTMGIRADPFWVILEFQLAWVLDFCLWPKKWEIQNFFEIGPIYILFLGLF